MTSPIDAPFFYSFQTEYDDDYCSSCHPPSPARPVAVQKEFMPTFYNPFETKHRRRTSRSQFKLLETSFAENTKPNAQMRRWLAEKLGMTPRSVQVWFQNRRAKAKGQMKKKIQPSPPPLEPDWPKEDSQWQPPPVAFDSFSMLMDQPELMAWYSPISSPLPGLLTPPAHPIYPSFSSSTSGSFSLALDEMSPLDKIEYHPFSHADLGLDPQYLSHPGFL